MVDNLHRTRDRTLVRGFFRLGELYRPAYSLRKSNSNHLHFKDPLFVRRDCPFRRNPDKHRGYPGPIVNN